MWLFVISKYHPLHIYWYSEQQLYTILLSSLLINESIDCVSPVQNVSKTYLA